MSTRSLLWALATMSLALTACSAGGPHLLMPATAQRGVAVRPAATMEPGGQWLLLTCADCDEGTLYFYHGDHPGQQFKALIINNAFAVAVDDSENLYVSGGGRNSPFVITEEYAQGGSFIYTDVVHDPTNVAPIAGKSAAFYVANGPEEIKFPTQGFDRSHGVKDSNLADVLTTAVDFEGHTYVGGSTTHGGFEVDLIDPNEKPVNLRLDLTGLPVGLILDAQGNLIVDERYVGVAVFAPGVSSPINWFDNKNSPYPVSIALGNGGERLYVLDNATVYVYSYPDGDLLWEYSVPHSLSCCTAQIAIEPRMPLFDPGPQRVVNSKFKYWTDFLRTDH